MTDAPDTKPFEPAQLPQNAQDMLRVILDAGNTAYVDDEDRIVAGTPDRPGQPVPADAVGMMACVIAGLIAGERDLIITRRRGRHLAQQGSIAAFDDSITDVDLAAWASGQVDYLTGELLEAVDGRFARVVTTRREALDLLIAEGVIRPDQAREDV